MISQIHNRPRCEHARRAAEIPAAGQRRGAHAARHCRGALKREICIGKQQVELRALDSVADRVAAGRVRRAGRLSRIEIDLRSRGAEVAALDFQPVVSVRERTREEATPPLFAQWLVSLARAAE